MAQPSSSRLVVAFDDLHKAGESRRRRRPLARLRLVAVAFAIPLTSQATAQTLTITAPRSPVLPNYDRMPIGQREGIEAGAFVARTNDAAAGWYNPAGLAQRDQSALNASATAYEWTRLTLSGLGATADRVKLSSVTTYFGVVLGRPLLRSDRWRIGFSVTRPLAWSPSTIDVAFRPPAAGGDELFGYTTHVDLDMLIPGVSVGYAPRGIGKSPIRLGAGLAIAHTSLTQALSVSDRVTTPASATTTLRSFGADGSVNHLVVTTGLQWDASSRIAVGMRFVSPGFRLTSSGSIALQSSEFSGSSAVDVAFRDEDASFDYRLPVEVAGGLVFRFGSGEVELDARFYGPIGRYALYESDSLARITTVSGTAPPVISSAPFSTTYQSARSVVNVAVGGNYAITRGLRVHGGFVTDASPVPSPKESILVKADLYRVTSGVSFTWTALSGSIGLAYGWGAGDRRSLGTSAAGLPVETRAEVQTFNLVYALSYSFGGASGQ